MSETVQVVATKKGFDGIAMRMPGEVFTVRKEAYINERTGQPSSWMKLVGDSNEAKVDVRPNSEIEIEPLVVRKRLGRPKKNQ